jgi:hypothetical protein
LPRTLKAQECLPHQDQKQRASDFLGLEYAVPLLFSVPSNSVRLALFSYRQTSNLGAASKFGVAESRQIAESFEKCFSGNIPRNLKVDSATENVSENDGVVFVKNYPERFGIRFCLLDESFLLIWIHNII